MREGGGRWKSCARHSIGTARCCSKSAAGHRDCGATTNPNKTTGSRMMADNTGACALAGCSSSVYRCTRAHRKDGKRCARTMRAEPLEQFVEDAAIRLLENIAVSPKRTRTAAVEAAERAIEDDERQLAELHDMWISKEIDTAEYRKDRRTIQARINQNQKKTVVRVKSPDAIADLIGRDAKEKWAKLTGERKNSVLRFLFSAVIIGEETVRSYPKTIDFGRVEIEQNEIA